MTNKSEEKMWEDSEIDFERGRKNGAEWEERGAKATDEQVREEYERIKKAVSEG